MRLYLIEKSRTGYDYLSFIILFFIIYIFQSFHLQSPLFIFLRNELFKLILETFVQETHYVTKTLLYEVIRGSLDTLHIGPDEAALNQIGEVNQKVEEGTNT